jgi:hypothetical protein
VRWLPGHRPGPAAAPTVAAAVAAIVGVRMLTECAKVASLTLSRLKETAVADQDAPPTIDSLRSDIILLRQEHQAFTETTAAALEKSRADQAAAEERATRAEGEHAATAAELVTAKAALLELQRVPSGSSTRSPADLSSMTPVEKIAYGLSLRQ